jgi:hypothetical protein
MGKRLVNDLAAFFLIHALEVEGARGSSQAKHLWRAL